MVQNGRRPLTASTVSPWEEYVRIWTTRLMDLKHSSHFIRLQTVSTNRSSSAVYAHIATIPYQTDMYACVFPVVSHTATQKCQWHDCVNTHLQLLHQRHLCFFCQHELAAWASTWPLLTLWSSMTRTGTHTMTYRCALVATPQPVASYAESVDCQWGDPFSMCVCEWL